MTEALPTYEDHLRATGRVTTDMFLCPCCGGTLPPFSFVERTPGDWICGSCYSAEKQEEAIANAPPPAPWESIEAGDVRALRVQLQERWRWAVMPDSPLIAEAQARVMAYLRLLNTLTIDYPSPEDVVWPVEPVINGEDYDANA